MFKKIRVTIFIAILFLLLWIAFDIVEKLSHEKYTNQSSIQIANGYEESIEIDDEEEHQYFDDEDTE